MDGDGWVYEPYRTSGSNQLGFAAIFLSPTPLIFCFVGFLFSLSDLKLCGCCSFLLHAVCASPASCFCCSRAVSVFCFGGASSFNKINRDQKNKNRHQSATGGWRPPRGSVRRQLVTGSVVQPDGDSAKPQSERGADLRCQRRRAARRAKRSA